MNDSIELAFKIRRNSLLMTHASRASHIGSCLSIADLLACIYTNYLNITPENTAEKNRDYFILSKGHAAAALYSTLAELNFFDPEVLKTYCKDGAPLGGHATHKGNNGVDISTGSLGHGLPIAAGFAYSQKMIHKSDNNTVVLISDGELNEGTTWETAIMANKYGLDNLTVIVDFNKIQSLDTVENVSSMEPLTDKWRAFNWEVEVIDGHNHDEIIEALAKEQKGPRVILANTVKGKGVDFMEGTVAWHYKSVDDNQLEDALKQIEELR